MAYSKKQISELTELLNMRFGDENTKTAGNDIFSTLGKYTSPLRAVKVLDNIGDGKVKDYLSQAFNIGTTPLQAVSAGASLLRPNDYKSLIDAMKRERTFQTAEKNIKYDNALYDNIFRIGAGTSGIAKSAGNVLLAGKIAESLGYLPSGISITGNQLMSAAGMMMGARGVGMAASGMFGGMDKFGAVLNAATGFGINPSLMGLIGSGALSAGAGYISNNLQNKITGNANQFRADTSLKLANGLQVEMLTSAMSSLQPKINLLTTMGIIDAGQALQLNTLMLIESHTSLLSVILEELKNQNEYKDKLGGNEAQNIASEFYGEDGALSLQDQGKSSKRQVNILQRIGKEYAKFGIGLESIFNISAQIGNTLSGKSSTELYNKFINQVNAQDAATEFGNKYGIATSMAGIIHTSSAEVLSRATTYESKHLAILTGIYELNRFQSHELLGIRKDGFGIDRMEHTGQYAKLKNRFQIESDQEDTVFKWVNELLGYIPGWQTLYGTADMTSKFAQKLADIKDNFSITDIFSNIGKEVKSLIGESFSGIESYNKKDIYTDIGAKYLSDSELMSKYLGQEYPNQFLELLKYNERQVYFLNQLFNNSIKQLQYNGVLKKTYKPEEFKTTIEDKVIDKITGKFISREDFLKQKEEIAGNLFDLMTNVMPATNTGFLLENLLSGDKSKKILFEHLSENYEQFEELIKEFGDTNTFKNLKADLYGTGVNNLETDSLLDQNNTNQTNTQRAEYSKLKEKEEQATEASIKNTSILSESLNVLKQISGFSESTANEIKKKNKEERDYSFDLLKYGAMGATLFAGLNMLNGILPDGLLSGSGLGLAGLGAAGYYGYKKRDSIKDALFGQINEDGQRVGFKNNMSKYGENWKDKAGGLLKDANKGINNSLGNGLKTASLRGAQAALIGGVIHFFTQDPELPLTEKLMNTGKFLIDSTGAIVGGLIGASVGSMIAPGVGTIMGAMLGGFAGEYIQTYATTKFRELLNKKPEQEIDIFTDSWTLIKQNSGSVIGMVVGGAAGAYLGKGLAGGILGSMVGGFVGNKIQKDVVKLWDSMTGEGSLLKAAGDNISTITATVGGFIGKRLIGAKIGGLIGTTFGPVGSILGGLIGFFLGEALESVGGWVLEKVNNLVGWGDNDEPAKNNKTNNTGATGANINAANAAILGNDIALGTGSKLDNLTNINNEFLSKEYYDKNHKNVYNTSQLENKLLIKNNGDPRSFDGLNDVVKNDLFVMAKEYYDRTGKPLVLNEGFRSYEHQMKLYNDYITGKSKHIVAKPGNSDHEKGFALDISSSQLKVLKEAGIINQLGYEFNVKSEDHHIRKIKEAQTLINDTAVAVATKVNEQHLAQNLATTYNIQENKKLEELDKKVKQFEIAQVNYMKQKESENNQKLEKLQQETLEIQKQLLAVNQNQAQLTSYQISQNNQLIENTQNTTSIWDYLDEKLGLKNSEPLFNTTNNYNFS